jgi:hypothetical protein
MNSAPDHTQFPSLFAHRIRTEWGVGILAGEKDGKRRYLFENGEERALASGFYELMLRVESPTPEQQLTYARLQGVLAARAGSDAGSEKTQRWVFSTQLARFRQTYSDGLSDSRWTSEVRGQGGKRAFGQRQATLQQAQATLSQTALDAAIEAGRFAEPWEALTALVASTDLVPAAQIKRKPAAGEPLRNLSLRLREMLHGEGPYEQRFDRWVTALTLAFGEAPRWELATAPTGLFHPREHVCVEATAFKKQLKACGGRAAASPQPTSSGYASFLSIARLVANQLASHGEVPRDLLDVRDFIVISLKPVAKSPSTTAKAPKKAPREEDDAQASADD